MPSLIVLAAGMGSRYGGLKQIDPMGPNGETVLDYSVYDALRAGFDRVIFVIREDFAEAFREGIGARFAGRIKVDYAFQKLDDLPDPFSPPEGRTKPWGTTHAVRAASPRTVSACPPSVAVAAVVTVAVPPSARRGSVTDPPCILHATRASPTV